MAYRTDQHHHHHHTAPYFAIFGALMVLTVASALADQAGQLNWISSKKIIAALVLAIATAKALFVMAFFMHLKFEGRWKYLLLAPTIILACGIPLALTPDIGMHYYPVEADKKAPVATSHDSSGHAPAKSDAHGDSGEKHDEHAPKKH